MCSTRVFDVVGVIAGRGVGRCAGRRRGRWRGLRWCSTLWAWLLVEGWVVACPARAPCPALPVRLRRSVFRHSLGAGCGVVAALPAGGRRWCRCRGSYGCSMSWLWLLAEGWVVSCPTRGRCRCWWGWLFVCSTLWLCSLAADWVVVLVVAVVDGVFHKSVRCCGCVRWSWYGSW